jgi:hypothetical protein
MEFLKIKNNLFNNLKNLPGWKTNRRIIIIESDDWGSIRMPSKKIYECSLKRGLKVDEDPYSRYDSLASEDDLIFLFDLLSKFKDQNSNSPIITANVMMANPDFEAIRSSCFEKYKYELFTETLKSYPRHTKSFFLWMEGLRNNLFYPQLHGREHLNVLKWMNALKKGNPELLLAFNYRMLTLPIIATSDNMNAYLDALEFDSKEEIATHGEIIRDAAALFHNVFGYNSKSIIAPCYIWSHEHEKLFKENGIEYIQGISYQYEPQVIPGTLEYRKRFHCTGEKNQFKQRYLVRNAFFEPSLNPTFDWVGNCLNRIEIAFRWHNPAIISSHRINFIGYIDPANRDRNLVLFKQLLVGILKKWPDVEFMSSDKLGELINTSAQ